VSQFVTTSATLDMSAQQKMYARLKIVAVDFGVVSAREMLNLLRAPSPAQTRSIDPVQTWRPKLPVRAATAKNFRVSRPTKRGDDGNRLSGLRGRDQRLSKSAPIRLDLCQRTGLVSPRKLHQRCKQAERHLPLAQLSEAI
jgi:hypothetical protein